ncbi:hypothetical protein [Desulfuromonas thiophila]|uniref:hypothetical protein n=1 Tax=Desulfuromonas thiophila TaxID=57664 RepID=UPI0024A8B84E|nr:hypothetical protein [Desulfuromonas thiophila]
MSWRGTAPEALKDFVLQARHGGITADYSLFDRWSVFPTTNLGLLKQKQQFICMLKAMKTITCGYQGLDLTLGDLYKSVRKGSGRRSFWPRFWWSWAWLTELAQQVKGEQGKETAV